jgi:hypothetical protein
MRGERFTQGFMTLTKLFVSGGIFVVCACALWFAHPIVTRLLMDIEENVDSYTMTGTTCEALKADLAFSEEIPPLSSREIQKDPDADNDTESNAPYVHAGTPVVSRRISESADLSYFYGEDVIACFGNPTYYYAYWQQEPEDRALIVEFVYPEAGLIFFSYSLSNGWGTPATLHPKTEFQRVRRIPPITAPTDLAPHLSYPWYDEKPLDPTWVYDVVYEWKGWEQFITP